MAYSIIFQSSTEFIMARTLNNSLYVFLTIARGLFAGVACISIHVHAQWCGVVWCGVVVVVMWCGGGGGVVWCGVVW